jgi:NADH dehydrogenase
VFAGDVGAAIASACEGRAKAGTIYELAGPEIITFRQLLDRVQEWSQRKRIDVPVPFWAAKLAALLTLPLPNRMRPLTVDQVRLLQDDNVLSADALAEGRTLAALDVEQPHTMETVVPSYLERFQPHGQYAHYRG